MRLASPIRLNHTRDNSGMSSGLVSPNWRVNVTVENAKQQLMNYKVRDLQSKSDSISAEIEAKMELLQQLDKKCAALSRPSQLDF